MTEPATPPADAAHSYECTARRPALAPARSTPRRPSSPSTPHHAKATSSPAPPTCSPPPSPRASSRTSNACQRFLPFTFDSATVDVHAERQDNPPKITRITYELTVTTDEPAHRVDLLHANIQRHGTIFNTLASVARSAEPSPPSRANATRELLLGVTRPGRFLPGTASSRRPAAGSTLSGPRRSKTNGPTFTSHSMAHGWHIPRHPALSEQVHAIENEQASCPERSGRVRP